MFNDKNVPYVWHYWLAMHLNIWLTKYIQQFLQISLEMFYLAIYDSFV